MLRTGNSRNKKIRCQGLRGVKLRVSAKCIHGFFGGDENIQESNKQDSFMPCGYIKNHRIVYLCNKSLFVLPAPK